MKSVWITEMGLKSNDSLCKRQNLCLPSKKLLGPQHHHPLKRGWGGGDIVLGHLQSQEITIWGVSSAPCRNIIHSRLDCLHSIMQSWEVIRSHISSCMQLCLNCLRSIRLHKPGRLGEGGSVYAAMAMGKASSLLDKDFSGGGC